MTLKASERPLLFMGFFFCVLVLSCARQDAGVSRKLEALMDQYHALDQFQGAVLVSQNNEIVFEKGYGEADREWHIPNTSDTKFRLGSATKTFTASLTMRLVQEGLLKLSGMVSEYLPDYRPDTGRTITIHHLLTHSSGIQLPDMALEEYWSFFQNEWSTDELVTKLCSGDLIFDPGTRFSYSSAGFMLLGAIIEEVTGITYEGALDKYIFGPYGLVGTGVDDPERILPCRASGYQTNYGYGNARYKYMPSSHASGALYSTVRDLFQWDQVLRSGEFLSDESVNLMHSFQIESHRGPFGYGWFMDAVEVSGLIQTRVFHAGDVSGFCALYVRVLETGDFVALLSNREGINYYEIGFSLLDILNGIAPKEPKELLADVLRRVYFSHGFDALRTTCESLQHENLENLRVDEDEMNELGYDILLTGDATAALEVFKINVELHPESSNAYDSLGEGYLSIGDTNLAEENYTKSLGLNPNNQNAINVLKSIQE